MKGASFVKTLLDDLVAPGVDFTGCTLRDATLAGANLEGAILAGVNGDQASFTGANLKNAKLQRFHDRMIHANRSEKGQRMLSMCRMTGYSFTIPLAASMSRAIRAISSAWLTLLRLAND